MQLHFIAIGGSAMHSLALAMHQLGHQVTGSDDAIFDPSKLILAMSDKVKMPSFSLVS